MNTLLGALAIWILSAVLSLSTVVQSHATIEQIPAGPRETPWRPVDPQSIFPTDHGYEEDYHGRLESIITSRNWSLPGGEPGAECADSYSDLDQGKYAWPALLANMWLHRANATALGEFINGNASYGHLAANGWLYTQKCGTFYKPFNAIGYTQYFMQWREIIPESQWNTARIMLLREGFSQTARLEGHLDPIYFRGEFDSENFYWMSRFSGLLWAAYWRDPYYEGFFYRTLTNAAKALLSAGRLEWDSNIYLAYVFQPALTVYDHTRNTSQRAQARALLDWLMVTVSLKVLDGFQVGPDARAKDVAALPFAGSAWQYFYLYYISGDYHPSFTIEDALAHWSVDTLGWFPYSAYRPPQVAVNIAQRRFTTPVLMHNAKPFYRINHDNYSPWSGRTDLGRRFEYETLFLERNYTLGSLAAGRPNGQYAWPVYGLYTNVSMVFSEQSVWRLGVLGAGGKGAQQVFGNSGSGFDELSGRSPWEQIGQSSNVLLRVISGTDVMWVAFPNDRPIVFKDFPPEGGYEPVRKEQAAYGSRSKAVFVDMSHGVFVAILPFNDLGNVSSKPFHRQAQNATQVTWSFSSRELGALALEVGTAADHRSFTQFIENILEKAHFNKLNDQTKMLMSTKMNGRHGGDLTVGGGTLSFFSSTGQNLTIEHTGIGEYTMVDGQICSPAGLYPHVYVDGERVEFEKFNSYEVVAGEKIVEQKWGAGQLTAIADGSGERITIDKETGIVTFEVLATE